MNDRPRSWPSRLIVTGVIGVAAVVVFQAPIRRALAARAFTLQELRRYEALIKSPPASASRNMPPRTGKVVVIAPSVQLVYMHGAGYAQPITTISAADRARIVREQDPPRLHSSWYGLDASIRATTPDEVDTVIFCDVRSIKDGVYVSKDPKNPSGAYGAYRRDAFLYVYDARTGQFLGHYVIHGEPSPQETTILGQHSGKDPDVTSAIESMPLRS